MVEWWKIGITGFEIADFEKVESSDCGLRIADCGKMEDWSIGQLKALEGKF